MTHRRARHTPMADDDLFSGLDDEDEWDPNKICKPGKAGDGDGGDGGDGDGEGAALDDAAEAVRRPRSPVREHLNANEVQALE